MVDVRFFVELMAARFADGFACSLLFVNSVTKNAFPSLLLFASLSGTSSGREGSVVASLECSPDGRCSGVTVSDLSVRYVQSVILVVLFLFDG